jgi:hypothetical protein
MECSGRDVVFVTVPERCCLPQWCSNWAMKSSNKLQSVDPWYTRLSMMPSCAYARRMCHLFPRTNFVTWIGDEPFGDHPQRRCPALPSQPDLSTKTSCRTCTATSCVDSDLEDRHPVVVRCVGSLFASNLLTSDSDRSISPISSCGCLAALLSFCPYLLA